MCSKNENSYIFQRKLSKLHKKDTILHVIITFFLKQGQTFHDLKAVVSNSTITNVAYPGLTSKSKNVSFIASLDPGVIWEL